ncbi:hypothetical protein [Nocardioides speluncae]|uniref:hypothetical protein n=1 Tax=Nocardioides speluncae TaxID=2670337 RepID=UPI000D69B54D|nr:hypothetical protein [Nocardioides speluncae]
MDDLHLKSRLDQALERQLEPMRPEVSEILAVSQGARRRRNARRSGLAVAVMTALVLGTSWFATSALSRLDSDSAEMASDPSGQPGSEPTAATEDESPSNFVVPQTDAEFTSVCRHASYSSADAKRRLFDAGQAELVAKTSNSMRGWALFESRGGALWGRCEIRRNVVEMAVFRTETDDTPADHYVRSSTVCGGGDCLTEAWLATKLPSQVATVWINFADNQVVRRATADGWIAMSHLLDLEVGEPAIKKVIYLNDGGAVLGEYVPGAGGQATDLPTLASYPALSEGQRLNYKNGNYTD